MADLNFPSAPADGATYTANGATYTYSSAKQRWYITNYANAPIGYTGSKGYDGSFGYTGSKGGETTLTTTDDTATAALYPVMVGAAGSSQTVKTTASKLSFNAATGVLDTSLLTNAGTATAGTAPIKLTSGTNLSVAEAGAIEYDGTTIFATPSANYGRGSLPALIYTSGAGTSLTTTTEATNRVLFPAANDTITLPVGTYYLELMMSVTRGTTSTTSAQLRVRFAGSTGTAVGTFSGLALGSGTANGNATANLLNGVTLAADNAITPASTTAAGVYNATVRGILRVTTSGTFIPSYSLSANISAGTASAPSAANYMILQSIETTGSAAATGAWA